mmetsp:Transcript_2332/g.3383  ORF Transcript_2332/g.3383 Transcript_2332/m.3383 type:complete len:353 (+) Transcript_2332:243-1301(+)
MVFGAMRKEDIVPETLLALAKDERYVRQCDEILKKIFPSNYQTSAVAWLLYAVLAVRSKHRTLGMEVCGIKLVTKNSKQHRLWLSMACSALVSIAVNEYYRKQDVDSSPQDAENLRGSARIQFYQAQREAMLGRRSSQFPSRRPSQADESRDTRTSETFIEKLKSLTRNTLLELCSSTVIENGPNIIPNSAPPFYTLAKWILRIQLAYFCVNGTFLSWKCLDINLESERTNLLANKPKMHKFVVLLLLQQVGANLVKGVVEVLTKIWVEKYKSSWQPAVCQQNLAERNELSTGQVCGICQQKRRNPAVPKSCGHIFCWECLYKWVSNTRPECPLCRAPCKPQHVVALYRYQP